MNLTPAPIMASHASPQLALELGSGLLSVKEVAQRHSLSKDNLKALMADPHFRNMVLEAKRNWNATMSAPERIRVKAQLAVEEAIPRIYEIFADDSLGTSARLDAIDKLAKLADTYPRATAEQATGAGFSLTINIPNAPEPTTITGEVLEHDG